MAVVVTSVVVLSALSGKRLSSSLLGGRVEILDLGLTENTTIMISY